MEWLRARARCNRWAEECQLVEEEMRRILAFFKWHELWWYKQVDCIADISDIAKEGINAYAYRQASIRQSMYNGCVEAWKKAEGLRIEI